MQNKDKGDGIEDSPLDMLLVILLEGASKEVVMPSSENVWFSRPSKPGSPRLENQRRENIGTLTSRSSKGSEFWATGYLA